MANGLTMAWLARAVLIAFNAAEIAAAIAGPCTERKRGFLPADRDRWAKRQRMV